MGLRKFALFEFSLRPEFRELVPTSFLQRNGKLWRENSCKVDAIKFSRTAQGSSLAIHLPDAQARCYITVQKDGLAFAALAD
jgi:hypothetical protein